MGRKGGESVSRSVVSDSLKSHGLGSHKAPPSMEFSRQEYWSGYPFPSLGDLPDPGIKLESPALRADSSLSQSPGKPLPTKSEPYLLLIFHWPKQVTWSPLNSTGNFSIRGQQPFSSGGQIVSTLGSVRICHNYTPQPSKPKSNHIQHAVQKCKNHSTCEPFRTDSRPDLTCGL